MLKKLKVILVGGLALCCLYLFAVYLRTDGSESIRNTLSLASDAQESAYPTGTPLDTPAPEESPAYNNTDNNIGRTIHKKRLGLRYRH